LKRAGEIEEKDSRPKRNEKGFFQRVFHDRNTLFHVFFGRRRT
jgi:hypothetical protein